MAKHYQTEKVTDEMLIRMIEDGVIQSVGDFLNSTDLSREREYSTYEYAGLPRGNLVPTGVSSIVDRSTTEVVEAYTAILCDLFLSNNKLARFIPKDSSALSMSMANDASMLVNDYIFCYEDGWQKLQSWIKAALLWKNAIIRWDWVEDYEYVYEEFDEIEQVKLDSLLSEDGVEIVGDLELMVESTAAEIDVFGGNPEVPEEEVVAEETAALLMYTNVKIKRKIDRSRVKFDVVPEENFRIARNASSIKDAAYVGVQVEVTRSYVRKWWPEHAAKIKDWDGLDGQRWNTAYTELEAARKEVTGQEYWQGSHQKAMVPEEASRELTMTESWLRVDRDGDGIAELKHFITIGDVILLEEYVDNINLASLNPIDIPHEFYGLSMADFTRSSTLANTAILRGFIENVYLTNYSPKLADPNVVDFSALQSMKPKQVIATNGNPTAAVSNMTPENISSSTVSLLEMLQVHKEQATGMSKAAQGLNDQLYVSGNSEAKVAAVQSASQKRIQHIARRFAETGFKEFIKGVYKTLKMNLKAADVMDEYHNMSTVDVSQLPHDMRFAIDIDIGDNSNANKIEKLKILTEFAVPVIEKSGQRHLLKPDAMTKWLTEFMDALNLNPLDYMEDVSTPEFAQKAQAADQQAQQDVKMAKDLEMAKQQVDIEQGKATAAYTMQETKNIEQDNARQLATAIDKHFQEWAEINIKATKEGAELQPTPSFDEIMQKSMQIMAGPQQPQDGPQGPQQGQGIDLSQIPPEIIQMAKENPEMLMQVAEQNGIPPEMVQQVLGQIQGA